jgi:hypothetical protein
VTTLCDLLREDPVDLPKIAAHLDLLDPDRRVAEVHAVPGALQGKLFHAAKGWHPLALAHFVPDAQPDRSLVRHYGKNSLPLGLHAFTWFEKRFARPEPGAKVAWGYNHGATGPFLGWGHFVLRSGPDSGEMHVDYYSLPKERLPGAPELAPQTRGLSRFVYGNMIDVLRGVSRHVCIGRAVKFGKPTGNYFLLCREEASSA